MTKATEREQQRGILSLKRTFLPLLFGILAKKYIFATLICKQKEFRGSVYQDIYRALRLLYDQIKF